MRLFFKIWWKTRWTLLQICLGVVTFDSMKLVESPLPQWLTLAWSEGMWWSLDLQAHYWIVSNEFCYDLFVDGCAVCIGVLGRGYFCKVQHADYYGPGSVTSRLTSWLTSADAWVVLLDWRVARVFVCELNSWQTCWASAQLFLAKWIALAAELFAALWIWKFMAFYLTAPYQLSLIGCQVWSLCS